MEFPANHVVIWRVNNAVSPASIFPSSHGAWQEDLQPSSREICLASPRGTEADDQRVSAASQHEMLLRQRHAGHRPEAGEWQRLCSGFSVDEGRADSLSMDGSAKLSVDVADGSSDKEHNGQKEEDIDAEQPLPDAEYVPVGAGEAVICRRNWKRIFNQSIARFACGSAKPIESRWVSRSSRKTGT